MVQPWSEDAFQRGVDLGEQATDPVAGRGDLPGEVVGKDFPTAGHLAFYAGLAPVTRRSGTSIRGEHPPRGGNKVLKRALFLLVGGTTGTACQGSHLDRVARGVLAGKLSQVQEHDNEKDVRSAGQRRSDTEHENASKAGRLMQRNPAGGDVVVAA